MWTSLKTIPENSDNSVEINNPNESDSSEIPTALTVFMRIPINDESTSVRVIERLHRLIHPLMKSIPWMIR